jgi:serine/threonine protein kinase
MDMDEVLAQGGFAVSRHKVYNQGLPPGMLGKGNFGCVYKASGHGSVWAIKKIEHASASEFLTQKEIGVLRLLNGHPNIVSLADVIVHPLRDWMFIVMEFVEGGDLLGTLTKHPQLFEEALIRAMMYHISCGLAHAHAAGVLHRDLKPENILLKHNLVPKIADFGLARTVGITDVCQTIAGTPGYMAPEVMDARCLYDFPADVYALGLIFADMLSDKCCGEWVFFKIPPADKDRFMKRWPAGALPGKKSQSVVALQKKLVCPVPGERASAYQLCKDLLELDKSDPMPCKLWSCAGQTPDAPPPKRMVTPMAAAEIAGRLGYAKGSDVVVHAEGQWHNGRVEHISTTACPGALQVRYEADEVLKTTLVCPWQFTTSLRPRQHQPPTGEQSRVTLDDAEGGRSASVRLGKNGRRSITPSVRTRGLRDKTPRGDRTPVPVVRNKRCLKENCHMQ